MRNGYPLDAENVELIAVAAIALIVFGPQKLPEIARTIGRFMSEVRRMASEVKAEFEVEVENDVVDSSVRFVFAW